MLLLAFMVDYSYRHSKKYVTTNGVTSKRMTNTVIFFFVGLYLVYVFTEGMRYGRGVDQIGVYGPYYINPGFNRFREYEPLFVLINSCVRAIDPLIDTFPFGSIFFVYAIFFIIGLTFLYNIFKDCSKYFLVFAILATLSFQEGFIRQALSASFIFSSIYFYLKKKWKITTLLLIASLFIHKGNILIIAILIFCKYFFKEKTLNWKITIPLFLLFEFVVQLDTVFDFMQYIVPFLHLSEDDQFSGYLMNTDYIELEMDTASEWRRSMMTEVLTASFYMASFYICFVLRKKYKKYSFIFNTYILCSLIFEPFRLYGTLSRAFIAGALLWFIPLSIALFEWKYNKKIIFRISILIMLAYVVTYYGRFVFFDPEARYLWDLVI